MNVEVKVEGGVARIFLNRPEKSNALTSAILEDLRSSVEGLLVEADMRVAVSIGGRREYNT